jgi:hypothetical protein
VIGDDIEDEFHAAFVEFIREAAQRGEIAEVRIMFEEIDSPVAVIRSEPGIFFDIFDGR